MPLRVEADAVDDRAARLEGVAVARAAVGDARGDLLPICVADCVPPPAVEADSVAESLAIVPLPRLDGVGSRNDGLHLPLSDSTADALAASRAVPRALALPPATDSDRLQLAAPVSDLDGAAVSVGTSAGGLPVDSSAALTVESAVPEACGVHEQGVSVEECALDGAADAVLIVAL